ncbi:MAG: formyltransferase [Steroidobacteraceae bacterium]
MTRAIVMAYSEVGVRCLQVLLDRGVEIPLVFTHMDDPGESQWFGSVKALAERHRLRVVTPDDPNTPEWIAEARAAAPDFLFSFYYRYMLSAAWLQIAPRGALNMHGSLLPKYRGRAAVHWAILNGESETGASLHYMLEKPDAGALVDQISVPIGENDTALDVSVRVAEAAAAVLKRSLPRLIAGTADARPLDLAQGSYFGRRRPEDGRIDWRKGARAVHDLVRAVAPPFPGAFTDVNGCRLAILETRVDTVPARYAARAPCLYSIGDSWYADCVDGRRLRILQMELDQHVIGPNAVPPALSNQPVALS